jgi:hypothetical protein
MYIYIHKGWLLAIPVDTVLASDSLSTAYSGSDWPKNATDFISWSAPIDHWFAPSLNASN